MNTFKKILGILLMLSLIVTVTVAFAACGNNGDGDTTDPDSTQTPDDTTPDDTTPDVPTTPLVKTVTYSITVKDKAGNPVKDVNVQIVNATGDSYIRKLTNESGVVTFSVAEGDWKAQVLSAPVGYFVDAYDTKYEFTNYAASIEISKPAGYIFTALFTDDGSASVIDGLTVSLYALVEGETYATEATATGTTNKAGQVAIEAAAGNYKAVLTDASGVFYAADVIITADAAINMFAFDVKYVQGTDESNPIVVTESFASELKANQVIWYSLDYTEGAYILIEDANAFVNYGGTAYSVAEGETSVKISLTLPEGETTGTAVFSVASKAEIPEGATTVSHNITIGYDAAQ